MLEDAGCILEGEYFFPLKTEGLVSKKYVNIDPLLTYPNGMATICNALMRPFQGQFDCIVGPATGGIPLAYTCSNEALHNGWFSHSCGGARCAFSEKDGQEFSFQRMGFADAVNGRKTLVVEDISSTGKTSSKVCRNIEDAGGTVIGVSLIWLRGDVTTETLQAPRLNALINEGIETFDTKVKTPPGWGELPLVDDIGHPEHFPDYPGPRIDLLKT